MSWWDELLDTIDAIVTWGWLTGYVVFVFVAGA